ncbi:M15 family metallopeptidase [Aquisalimonas lutea]|uniref:M15 family metallopeptidase n=1 Tax=Aquisalimonas lutea TaxID=1327750 RepID=UPI0025B627A8|nr:M15 family metallopeptidase [Aquisalimonas lutea]MDN3519148.1 M15 family metallopeptidase [Aquisalimonas lutea]
MHQQHSSSSAVIPPVPSSPDPDWERLTQLPIRDNAEQLVPVSLAPGAIKAYPVYARLGIPGAVPECFVREGVYHALLAAARALPEGLSLLVLDGWRPWRVQRHLFDTLYETIRQQDPELTETQLRTRTREFVSLPSRDPEAPSPHLTGGAVDVTLCGADGLPLDMGTLFDEPLPASHTDYFERLASPTSQQRRARDHRRLLYDVMGSQGFTNLPSEWWHFDLGDQLWAYYGEHDAAVYGTAELDTIERRWRRNLT